MFLVVKAVEPTLVALVAHFTSVAIEEGDVLDTAECVPRGGRVRIRRRMPVLESGSMGSLPSTPAAFDDEPGFH